MSFSVVAVVVVIAFFSFLREPFFSLLKKDFTLF
uniref:Uncharacterized protein n=1 Tax=Podoviridae sp. ctFbF42 TaxID=2825233 RepID=A0A8S5PY84_9CAUD|nr:MAG TPA: hypothetical protein [Podoviridae sp. ctFbF42]